MINKKLAKKKQITPMLNQREKKMSSKWEELFMVNDKIPMSVFFLFLIFNFVCNFFRTVKPH